MSEQTKMSLIKADRQGRTQYSAEYRREALDAFSQSGQSAMTFAEHLGVKYSTFASWVSKAKRTGRSRPIPEADPGPKFLLAEVREEINAESSGVRVSLPGGLVAQAGSREEVALLADLIKALVGERHAGMGSCGNGVRQIVLTFGMLEEVHRRRAGAETAAPGSPASTAAARPVQLGRSSLNKHVSRLRSGRCLIVGRSLGLDARLSRLVPRTGSRSPRPLPSLCLAAVVASSPASAPSSLCGRSSLVSAGHSFLGTLRTEVGVWRQSCASRFYLGEPTHALRYLALLGGWPSFGSALAERSAIHQVVS